MERKLIFCNASVVINVDTSREGIQKAIIGNSLKANCHKINQQVGVEVGTLFGSFLFSCQNGDCPFNSNHPVSTDNLTSGEQTDKLVPEG